MTTQRDERIPALTLGWRLKMALAHADISRVQMAEQLGVDPATVSRWCADRGAPPRRAYLSQWALATDVPAEWLEHGVGGPHDGPGGSVTPQYAHPVLAGVA